MPPDQPKSASTASRRAGKACGASSSPRWTTTQERYRSATVYAVVLDGFPDMTEKRSFWAHEINSADIKDGATLGGIDPEFGIARRFVVTGGGCCILRHSRPLARPV